MNGKTLLELFNDKFLTKEDYSNLGEIVLAQFTNNGCNFCKNKTEIISNPSIYGILKININDSKKYDLIQFLNE